MPDNNIARPDPIDPHDPVWLIIPTDVQWYILDLEDYTDSLERKAR